MENFGLSENAKKEFDYAEAIHEIQRDSLYLLQGGKIKLSDYLRIIQSWDIAESKKILDSAIKNISNV